MKKHFLMTLPLAASLMVPAMAQNTTPSTPANQPPMQQSDMTSQNSQSQIDKDLSARQPLQMETREGFWGHLNPFARKKYVKRQLDPIRGRVNELDELTSANSKMIRDVDSRATEGIRLASNKANEADAHAVEAGNRAQIAHETAQQAAARLQTVEQAVTKIDEYQPITQAEIRFRPGQVSLSKKAKEALDDMAVQLKDKKGYIVEVQGFSSNGIGSSRTMAEAVVRYLVINHEIPVYRIYTLGMGNAPVKLAGEDKVRRTRGGRVEVSLMKNSISDLQTVSVNNGGPAVPVSSPSGSATPSSSMSNMDMTSTSTSNGQVNSVPATSTPVVGQPKTSQPQTPPVPR